MVAQHAELITTEAAETILDPFEVFETEEYTMETPAMWQVHELMNKNNKDLVRYHNYLGLKDRFGDVRRIILDHEDPSAIEAAVEHRLKNWFHHVWRLCGEKKASPQPQLDSLLLTVHYCHDILQLSAQSSTVDIVFNVLGYIPTRGGAISDVKTIDFLTEVRSHQKLQNIIFNIYLQERNQLLPYILYQKTITKPFISEVLTTPRLKKTETKKEQVVSNSRFTRLINRQTTEIDVPVEVYDHEETTFNLIGDLFGSMELPPEDWFTLNFFEHTLKSATQFLTFLPEVHSFEKANESHLRYQAEIKSFEEVLQIVAPALEALKQRNTTEAKKLATIALLNFKQIFYSLRYTRDNSERDLLQTQVTTLLDSLTPEQQEIHLNFVKQWQQMVVDICQRRYECTPEEAAQAVVPFTLEIKNYLSALVEEITSKY